MCTNGIPGSEKSKKTSVRGGAPKSKPYSTLIMFLITQKKLVRVKRQGRLKDQLVLVSSLCLRIIRDL